MAESPPPVFIHSLFRSGSTYLFDVFRQSSAKYWCYQEPENEMLLHLTDTADSITDTARVNATLRHPQLDRPYLAEFVPIREEVAHLFSRHFPYDSFFLTETDAEPDLRRYLELLIMRAQGRPVLQFCRSTGRIGWLRRNFTARHLFLWRHPWDQWWSYKVAPYFDTANLLILNANTVPPVFQEIRDVLGFQPYHDTTLEREFAFFDSHRLTAADSYLLFFALWYHAMQEGLCSADVVIGIDALSRSAEYRQQTLGRLADCGINGIDFSGCRIYQGYFHDKDAAFFDPIEEKVVRLFAAHGYSETIAGHIAELRSFLPRLDEPAWEEEILRLREMFKEQGAEAVRTRHLIWAQRLEIERLMRCETELLSIYRSRPWKILHPLLLVFWKLRARFRKPRFDAKAANAAKSMDQKL